MGLRAHVTFDCTDLGKRVTVRYRLPDGMATDVVGILEHCNEATIAVRDKRSALTYVALGDLIAGKVIASPSWQEQDEAWDGPERPGDIAPG